MLRYLQHDEIDKAKWDNCVLQATNTLIYAQSFYLDNCTTKKWEALVLNDYEAVMPLTVRKKYGIKYLYQPTFLQQAGIFSVKKITEETVIEFLLTLTTYFKFAEINLNFGNPIFTLKNILTTEQINYLLPLNNSFAEITSNYKNNFTKNIKRANKVGFSYFEDTNYTEFVNLYKKLYHQRFNNVSNNDYAALKANCHFLQTKNELLLKKVLLNKNIMATVILFKDKNRLYNIASSVTTEGKKLRANYFLYDKIIEEFAGTNLILDFEGSNIKGIADFYKSTEPISEHFFSIKFNNLPALLKVFKK